MALLFPFFYLLGFKTISPDTTILTGSGEIILTSDKPIPEIYYSIYSCIKEPVDETTTEFIEESPGKVFSIYYDMNRDKCLTYFLSLHLKGFTCLPIVYYNID